MVSAMIRKIRLIILAIIILVLGARLPDRQAGFSVLAASAEAVSYVRVAIIQDAVSLNLKINGSYEFIDSQTNKIICREKNLNTTVTTDKNSILIADKNLKAPPLLIKIDDRGSVVINGRIFRGDISLGIKNDNGHLLAINQIDLEDYIKGILYHEVSHYWPQEALKAQAVVCRTYAAYQMQESKLKSYDVTSDIYSQVYGGKTSERYRTSLAVDDTRGEVIMYQDKLVPAYFHATCGGHTEDANLLWKIDIVPLKGVSCGFCQDSPHFHWHNVLTLAEIAEKLIRAGYKAKGISNITVLGRDSSGRITDLEISAQEKKINISAKDFRNIIGPNVIRSANFQVSIVEHDAIFEGIGWGHGVGLCQWGAYFMAKQGYGYRKILQYYYPQTDVKTF